MLGLGWQEILLILVIALLIFGPRKLPEIGRSLGKAISEFRKVTSNVSESIEKALEEGEQEEARQEEQEKVDEQKEGK